MIVLPLFWDQYDNAQRVQELGFGLRLATYDFNADELLGAVDRLLADPALRARAAASVRRSGLATGCGGARRSSSVWGWSTCAAPLRRR